MPGGQGGEMRRALNIVLPACLWVGLSLACEKKGDQIKIGAVVPLTGDGATFGTSARRGFEMAVAEWNGNGGVLGKPVKLIVADDKGDPAEGATAVTMLIHQRKVVGVLGPAMSKVSLAAAPIAQDARIPLIASASTNIKVTQVGDFIFRACFVDPNQGSAGAGFAFHELKSRKAACIFDLGNDYATGISEVFKATFIRLGGEVVAFEGHASGAADFKAQLTKALKAGPEVIYAPDFYGDAALITQQARELGFKGPLLGADGWDSPKLIELGRKHMENTFFTTHFSPEDPSPAVQTFVGSYKARHGERPDGHATMGYEAAAILLAAIRRAGTTDGRAVRDAIAQTNLRLVTGQITFDAQRNPIKPIVFLEVKGGRPVFRTTRLPDPSEPQDSPHPGEHEVMTWR
jgi:branched-chain amino acid transport system substrate-binding protein